ncbi:MAG TPA: hypothetical protein VGG82_00655 [Casimicrobiaceae bacterium]|jgi:hypothetical protein
MSQSIARIAFSLAAPYNDRSDEESWVRLPDGRVMTYTFVSLLQLQ